MGQVANPNEPWPDLTHLATAFKTLADKVQLPTGFSIPTVDYCKTLKSDALALIRGKKLLIIENVREWEVAAQFPDKTDKKQAIEELTAQIYEILKPVFKEASSDVAGVAESVERAHAILRDTEIDCETAIARARDRIQAFSTAYDDSKPWSSERRNSYEAGLRTAANGVFKDIEAAIDEARHRFAVELSDAAQSLSVQTAKLVSSIKVAPTDAMQDIGSLKAVASFLFANAVNALDTFGGPESDDPRLKQIDAMRSVVKNANASADAKNFVNGVLAQFKNSIVELRVFASSVASEIGELQKKSADEFDAVTEIIKRFAAQSNNLLGSIQSGVNAAQRDLEKFDDPFKEVKLQLTDLKEKLDSSLKNLVNWSTSVSEQVAKIGTFSDALKNVVHDSLSKLSHSIQSEIHDAYATVDAISADITNGLKRLSDALAPASLLTSVLRPLIAKTLDDVLAPVPDSVSNDSKDAALECIRQTSATLQKNIEQLSETALGALDFLDIACAGLTGDAISVQKYFEGLKSSVEEGVQQFKNFLTNKFGEYVGSFEKKFGDFFPNDTLEKTEKLNIAVDQLDSNLRSLRNNLSSASEAAQAYRNRVFDAVGKLGSGGIMAAPGKVLNLYSAVTTAPEIAALKADTDRIRASFDEEANLIQTTKATAMFNRLGDELKALGLSVPFNGISDRLVPDFSSVPSIGSLFRQFGGCKLEKLLEGYSLPPNLGEAVRISTEFNPKQGQAWVQIDIDAPLSGRRSLFALGVFQADCVDMRLTGRVRLEASKDSEKVTQTGFSHIGTTLDLAVSGQSMVTFENFGLSFTRERQLELEFDPKGVRLNPSLQFIQDFLSQLFPDNAGGLKVVKQNGIPIGVEHEFEIPPISFNFGTSGISNISISNHFQLLAYPDFVISNRFRLSRPERPFIFSVFIIGGTGYVEVDARYRPFHDELTVTVEAGAGGSAAIAFAFGPFVGQVMITLSVTLSYRKTIGQPGGGGLSIGALLVVAGYVNVAGIVTVAIYVTLRMTYRDTGQVDADGTLSVTIRICRFFELSARAEVHYKLRDGHAEVTTNTGISARAGDALKKLQGARS